ncbi:MAG: hypothetical protein GKR87_15870 [Kiritimatiellae bacterium]|nr:hypothetical protein [Kiritimatiellia bacterium]
MTSEFTPKQEAIVKSIRRRKRNKLPLYSSNVNGQSGTCDRTLYEAAIRHFGSWPQAIEIAGFDYAKINRIGMGHRKHKNAKEVIAAIQKRKEKKLPMNAGYVNLGPDRDRTLYSSARREYGHWANAVKAAGYNYNLIKKETIVEYKRKVRTFGTRQDIIDAIQKRKKGKLPLHLNGVNRGKDANRTLYQSAVRDFGSWTQAVKAAGYSEKDIAQTRKRRANVYPTAQLVLQELRRRDRKDLPLTSVEVYKGKKHRDPALCIAARKFYLRWHVALMAAGILDLAGNPITKKPDR